MYFIKGWVKRVASLRRCSEREASERVADVIAINLGYRTKFWNDYFREVDKLASINWS